MSEALICENRPILKAPKGCQHLAGGVSPRNQCSYRKSPEGATESKQNYLPVGVLCRPFRALVLTNYPPGAYAPGQMLSALSGLKNRSVWD